MIKQVSYVNASDIFPTSIWEMYETTSFTWGSSSHTMNTLDNIFNDMCGISVQDFLDYNESELSDIPITKSTLEDIIAMKNNILKLKEDSTINGNLPKGWENIMVDMEH